MSMLHHPVCLTIAGSDSGGGAGIQADIKAMTILGCFATSAITALTAQDGEGVRGIFAPPAEFTVLQMQTVLSAFPVRAAKTGMLFSADIIEGVAGVLENAVFPIVVDPVCVSQSGNALLQDDALEALRRFMLPLATLLTPNRPEAEALTGLPIRDQNDVAAAAKRLFAMGAKAVLIKGGHFDAEEDGCLTDWFCEPGRDAESMRQKKIDTPNTHGTGCTLSAAIAAYLAKGLPLREAVLKARAYLHQCLRDSYTPGKGSGPVNHCAPVEEK